MLKIKRDILIFDDKIKERLEFIVNYTNRKTSFRNGNIGSVLDINLHYIEPHIMFIEKHKFLLFNYNIDIYCVLLNTKIEMKNNVGEQKNTCIILV